MSHSKYNTQKTIIVPESLRDKINSVLERHGYGPDNLSVQLKDENTGIVYYSCTMLCNDVMSGIIEREVEKLKQYAEKMSVAEPIYCVHTCVENIENIDKLEKGFDHTLAEINKGNIKGVGDIKECFCRVITDITDITDAKIDNVDNVDGMIENIK